MFSICLTNIVNCVIAVSFRESKIAIVKLVVTLVSVENLQKVELRILLYKKLPKEQSLRCTMRR